MRALLTITRTAMGSGRIRARLGQQGIRVASAVFLAACASGGGPGAGGSSGDRPAARSDDMGGSRVQTAVLQSAGGASVGVNMVSSTTVGRTLVPGMPEVVFQALATAYGTLKIPVTDLNQASRTIGNPVFKIRRRIGDVPTMRALDCGGDSGMPNAETYQLTLSIQSRVVAADAAGMSVVESTLEGSGRNATTAASSDVRCTSLGVLEKRIGELVKQTLAAGK